MNNTKRKVARYHFFPLAKHSLTAVSYARPLNKSNHQDRSPRPATVWRCYVVGSANHLPDHMVYWSSFPPDCSHFGSRNLKSDNIPVVRIVHSLFLSLLQLIVDERPDHAWKKYQILQEPAEAMPQCFFFYV
jgi:hypothetical protein